MTTVLSARFGVGWKRVKLTPDWMKALANMVQAEMKVDARLVD